MATENLNDTFMDQLLRENDETCMALPDIESDPHLLISKVRKHYMEYVVKLLSVNYETNQKLINKNIYLPSAIWRCAKTIEMNAAQACMVVQLYRKNIISVVNELKNDTKKGKLNKKLYECLSKPPQNNKKSQTHSNGMKDSSCQCGLNKRKRRHGNSMSPKHGSNENHQTGPIVINSDSNSCHGNMNVSTGINVTQNTLTKQSLHVVNLINPLNINSPQPVHRPSVDTDELMMQLDKLFEGDHNDDDIFDGALCEKLDPALEDNAKNDTNIVNSQINTTQDSVIENHAAQIKSLDERLASLTGLLVNNDCASNQNTENQKSRKSGSSKWLCEEYYLKQKLYELLDQIGDNNRKNLEKIKTKFVYYFGYDSDDEGIISPLDETPEFIVSCKERIAPWVVKILTPYYIKGNIKGKGVFKSLAKHLIRLIYQCSRYPEEYEVSSFVLDFLKNHKTITCEADFKEFRIENI